MNISSKNAIQFETTQEAAKDYEYGFVANLEIPEVTPVPNRWWIEYYTVTGNAAAPFDYIASLRAELRMFIFSTFLMFISL